MKYLGKLLHGVNNHNMWELFLNNQQDINSQQDIKLQNHTQVTILSTHFFLLQIDKENAKMDCAFAQSSVFT